jgi:hypothetical protein
MNNPDNVLNLLIDPDSGNIYHVSSLAQNHFGLPAEKLRGMAFSRVFRQTVADIVGVIDKADCLREVTLQMRDESPNVFDAKAFASLMTIDNRVMLFLCVFRMPETPPTFIKLAA